MLVTQHALQRLNGLNMLSCRKCICTPAAIHVRQGKDIVLAASVRACARAATHEAGIAQGYIPPCHTAIPLTQPCDAYLEGLHTLHM